MEAVISTAATSELNNVIHSTDHLHGTDHLQSTDLAAINEQIELDIQRDIDAPCAVHQNVVYAVNNKVIGCISDQGAFFFSTRDSFLARFSSDEAGITEALIDRYGESLEINFHQDNQGPTMGDVLESVYGFIPAQMQ